MPTASELNRFSGGREGLRVTSEEMAGQVASLVRELEGYEQRAKACGVDKDDDGVEKWENRAEQVREQLRARGADASTPHRRAAKREGRPGQEVRA